MPAIGDFRSLIGRADGDGLVVAVDLDGLRIYYQPDSGSQEQKDGNL
jgi:hypothetical protein